MNAISQTEAQQRADEIRAFEQELGRLEHEGVLRLSEEQKNSVSSFHESLLANYAHAFDIDRSTASRQLSIGMRIASFLGALTLAASIFFMFYQFWGNLSTASQVSMLIVATLGTFLATLWIQGRDRTGYFTKLSALVAFSCFVLNISMLGQIFNITPSDKAFVVWVAYAFLLAYACELRLLLAAGILCMVGYLSAQVGTWSGMYWLYFGERPENFFPASIVLFFIPQIFQHRRLAGFPTIYRVFSLLTLFLPLLVLSNGGESSYLELNPEFIKHSYQIAGFLLSSGAIWLGIRRHWQEVVNTGEVFFVIFLFTKFYDWWWDIMPKYLFFLVLGLVALLVLVVLKRLRTLQAGGAK